MKKQKAFTLIELMVVMAIIAILATAGLSAYTGYIKKSRDTKRIEDVRAINTIIQGSLSVNGSPPASMDAVVAAANNGQMLTDPLGSAAVCLTDATGDTLGACGYTYSLCDDGAWYLISAKLESKSNQEKYTETGGASPWYHVGSCTAWATGGTATILVAGMTWMTADLSGYYQWMRESTDWDATWEADIDHPDYGDPCTAADSDFRMPTLAEWQALLAAESITDLNTAVNSTLGLRAAGWYDYSFDANLYDVNAQGVYWSSNRESGSAASNMYFGESYADISGYNVASGYSVRCLKD